MLRRLLLAPVVFLAAASSAAPPPPVLPADFFSAHRKAFLDRLPAGAVADQGYGQSTTSAGLG